MSHLNTAYELGVKQAAQDFQVELNKLGAPGQAVPPPSPVPTPVQPGVGGGIHNQRPGNMPPPQPVSPIRR